MIKNDELSNWLSAERRWDAAKRWMHDQGRMISAATLRRAFDENGRTARQRLAIDLARQYYMLINGPSAGLSSDTIITAQRTTLPVM